MSAYHPAPDGHDHPAPANAPQGTSPSGYAQPDPHAPQDAPPQHQWAPHTGGWSEDGAWPQAQQSKPKGLSIAAIVLGLIGVLFVPVLFGGAGIVCAAIAKSKGHELSTVALVVSIGGTALGVVLGVVVGISMAG